MATQGKSSPLDQMIDSTARLDFAANVFQGMPCDFWSEKLGWDSSKWADEALAIRSEFEAAMLAKGVGVNLPRVPLVQLVGSPNGGLSGPLEEFYQKLNTPAFAQQNTTGGKA